MQLHILSVFCALTNEYVPRVVESVIKGSEKYEHFHWPDFVRFGDSDSLILTAGDRLHVSFDNGVSWEAISGIKGTDMDIFVDEFHQGRAFVCDRSSNIAEVHITEDEGKNWRQSSLPDDDELRHTYCSPVIHPFNRNLVLVDCSVTRMKSIRDTVYSGENIVYGSDDAGKSFRRITTSETFDSRTECQFAASDPSRVEDNGIYCIETIDKSKSIRALFSNNDNEEAGEINVEKRFHPVSTLFYTTVFGKNKKTFDEFNDLSVRRIFIASSGIVVATSDAGGTIWEPLRLWIYRNGSFKMAHLPEGVIISYVHKLSEDEEGRLVLTAYVKDSEISEKSKCSFVSDSSGINFSFQKSLPQFSSHTLDQASHPLGQMGNLKGTRWRTFRMASNIEEKINASNSTTLEQMDNPKDALQKGSEEKVNWLHKGLLMIIDLLTNLFSKKSETTSVDTWWHPPLATQISFDNGKTWGNLRIVDSSGKYRNLFKCDIDDVERCSLQTSSFFTEEPTAGIIMSVGVAGENNSQLLEDQMTFISRDGGMTWELAFEFPVTVKSLDYGNIIIAIPKDDLHAHNYTTFFFSLDQGRTWKEYQFEKPIHPNAYDARFYRQYSGGLKICMGFNALKGGILNIFRSVEYIYYFADFANAFDGTACTAKDWEKWYLSNGTCIDGKKYSFYRRKPDAKCLMRKTFEKLELEEERCEP